MSVDQTDQAILKILQEDSRFSFREIGERTHLTGQAVGVRIGKMLEKGVIRKFSIEVDKEKLGVHVLALIKIYMKTNEHQRLKKLIAETDEIVEANKISGDGCYFLKVETEENGRLNEILEGINEFANYQLSLSVDKLK